MNSRFARVAGVMAAALIAAGSQAALAQPGGGPGRGPGPDHGLAIEHVLASLKTQLNLNTSQQVMWDNAVAHAKSARASTRGGMDQVQAALKAELAKAEPDFAAVATIADQAQASNQAARKQVRDEWLRLYATFSPAQKAVVRDALRERVARMEAFRDKMKERFQSRQGPAS
ncbi:MAG: periplasmic heavy metal sensor [Burkholderiales bacterium]|nr:periplasmic heavy metal sensor [Burkholderiales bacterium]